MIWRSRTRSEPPYSPKTAQKLFNAKEPSREGEKRVPPYFAPVKTVLVVTNYTEEIKPDGTRIINNHDPPYCPDCGNHLAGYDHRRRTVKDDAGNTIVYRLRRLYCRQCGCLHLEMPDTIQPQKHYGAALVNGTISGNIDYCPADDSTIRRWKKRRKIP